jgi:hypothetical protein
MMRLIPPCKLSFFLYWVSNLKLTFVPFAGFSKPALVYMFEPATPGVARYVTVWKPPPVMNPVPPVAVVNGYIVSPVNA